MIDSLTKNRCKYGDEITKLVISIPIGKMEMEACSKGLHKLKFKDVYKDEFKNMANSTKKIPGFKIEQKNDYKSIEILSIEPEVNNSMEITNECISFLNYYFSFCSIGAEFWPCKLPAICWSGICQKNTFTEKVLKLIYERIKSGDRITYKDLSIQANNPNAQRAVGSCMRNNPIALIIPCHRVVKTDLKSKNIGNYTGGVEIKEWLLDYESKYKIDYFI